MKWYSSKMQAVTLSSLLALSTIFGGCAASYDNSNSAAAAESSKMYSDSGPSDSYVMDAAMMEEMGYEQMQEIEYEADEVTQADSQAKRIYSANVSLQTKTFDDCLTSLNSLVNEFGGFVENEDIQNAGMLDSDSSWRHASMLYRIPSESFEAFLERLPEAGYIVNIGRDVQNITKNYYDVKTEIDSLQAELTRLNELLGKAESVADIIAIEAQISDVQTRLKSYQNDLSYMDLDLGYSRIYVDVSQVQTYTNTQQGFFTQIGTALRDTWIVFMNGIRDLLVAFIYLLPWLLTLALIGFVIYRIVKKRKGTFFKKSGKSQKASDMPQTPDQAAEQSKDEVKAETGETPD